jgi:hypothetical protein
MTANVILFCAIAAIAISVGLGAEIVWRLASRRNGY